MKSKIIITAILLCVFTIVRSQNSKTPHTIFESNQILDTLFNETKKEILVTTKDDSLNTILFPWNNNYRIFYEWTKKSNQNSPIKKYLSTIGIFDSELQQLVLISSFKKFLLKDSINQDSIINEYILIQQRWSYEDENRFTIDSLRGFYIPKNIEDCFPQIDKLLSDSEKTLYKKQSKKDFWVNKYFDLGFWMINNWRLKGDSRLAKYFEKLGIKNQESSAVLILKKYHQYLNEKK